MARESPSATLEIQASRLRTHVSMNLAFISFLVGPPRDQGPGTHNRYSEIQRKQIGQRPLVQAGMGNGANRLCKGENLSICRASRLVLPSLKIAIRKKLPQDIKVYLQAGHYAVLLVDA